MYDYIDIFRNMISFPKKPFSIHIYIYIPNPGFLEENPYFNEIWEKPGDSMKNLQNVRVQAR